MARSGAMAPREDGAREVWCSYRMHSRKSRLLETRFESIGIRVQEVGCRGYELARSWVNVTGVTAGECWVDNDGDDNYGQLARSSKYRIWNDGASAHLV